MKYAVVIERTRNGYSAYVPDLPGCAAAGTSMGVRRLIRQAIEFHLEGMQEDGLTPPRPSATTAVIDAKRPVRTRTTKSSKVARKARATPKFRAA